MRRTVAEVFGDFSVWQGTIDWPAYKAAGYKRVAIKATEGIGFIDPKFHYNAAGALPLQRIFYGYGRPDLNPNNPEGEADFLWETVAPTFAPGDYVEQDFEQPGASIDYEQWKRRWFARMAMHTTRYGLYSGAWFMNPRGISWWTPGGYTHMASYGPELAPGMCDIQQYTSSASFPGVVGNCDANWLSNPAALAGGVEVDVTRDEMIQLLNDMWGKAYGIGGSPTAWQDGPAAILDTDRKTLTTAQWNNADLEGFKTKDLPAIQAEAKRIADAIWAAGGHPADVAINEALKNINNLVNGAVTKIDAVKADTADVRAHVDKDLA